MLSPAIAVVNLTDLASFVFGGIVAFVEANKAYTRSLKRPDKSVILEACSTGWFGLFCLSLFLGSYPSGDANAPWCLWMHSLATFFGIVDARQIMIWWMNLSSFFICLCISQLPWAQVALSLKPALYLGGTSFAMFLVHPLILQSAGGHLFSILHKAGLGYDLAASTMGLTTLLLSLVVSHFWRTYVEIEGHLFVEKYLIKRADGLGLAK